MKSLHKCCVPELPSLGTLSLGELLRIDKPGRYLGGEVNSIVKSEHDIDVHVALCFPDAYEIGMSHLGLQILYDLFNRDERAWAERVFMPFPDMEAALRANAQRLSSLESNRALKEFDVAGFSLQYELAATNVLAMLELGGVGLYAAERPDDAPLVIGGGPLAMHPEPFAAFFDAFFLGDAEDFVSELLGAVRTAKSGTRRSRQKLLAGLRRSGGFYIPQDFVPRYAADGTLSVIDRARAAPEIVERRVLPELRAEAAPGKFIVPNIRTVHDRLNIEVMRGCIRGCRFCQAGYIYRPQRELAPERVLERIRSSAGQTGFEEVSLLSLSTADYCAITPLLKRLMDQYAEDDVLSVSMPSTRVDALSAGMLEQIRRVKKSGFTIAPEAGTQRLRDVINKNLADQEILDACSAVFDAGWNGVKLYFMLGLPTETEADLDGIAALVQRIRSLSSARRKTITVSVSTLVPKPHTPFQWAEQISPAETRRRQDYLAAKLRALKVSYQFHDARLGLLEGVIARGGRELAALLAAAWRRGCRFDAWTEHFDFAKWEDCFAECGINAQHYLRARNVDEVLPWDHLSCGIPKEYLAAEYRRALAAQTTESCIDGSCSGCGICGSANEGNIKWPWTEDQEDPALINLPDKANAARPSRRTSPVMRIRLRYSKTGPFALLGHLEMVQVFQRASRRANLPVCYTQGFHPLPRLTFGPPLQLGVFSGAEYFDAYLFCRIDPRALCETFNRELPRGLHVNAAEEIALAAPALVEQIASQCYRVWWQKTPQGVFSGADYHVLSPEKAALLFVPQMLDLSVERQSGKNKSSSGMQVFRLADYLRDVRFLETRCGEAAGTDAFFPLQFSLLFSAGRACPKATEVVSAISGLELGDYYLEKCDVAFRSK